MASYTLWLAKNLWVQIPRLRGRDLEGSSSWPQRWGHHLADFDWKSGRSLYPPPPGSWMLSTLHLACLASQQTFRWVIIPQPIQLLIFLQHLSGMTSSVKWNSLLVFSRMFLSLCLLLFWGFFCCCCDFIISDMWLPSYLYGAHFSLTGEPEHVPQLFPSIWVWSASLNCGGERARSSGFSLVLQLPGYLIACKQYNLAQSKCSTNVNFHFLPFTREKQYLVLWSENLAGVGASRKASRNKIWELKISTILCEKQN